MRKIIILFILLLISGFFVVRDIYNILWEKTEGEKKALQNTTLISISPTQPEKKNNKNSEITPVPAIEEKNCAIAVYWVDFKNIDLSNYNKLLYFGVAPTLQGEIAKDQGFVKLNGFVSSFYSFEKGLIVRMVDKNLNSQFLKKSEVWESFLKELYKLAKERGFSEISFDIELSSFQEDLKEPLTEFLKKAKELNTYGFKLSFIAYADSFYRNRPFDFEKISRLVDKVYLMAYDFTKTISEPGPNFPLEKGKWGYSLLQAVDDFSQYFEKDKITVIFGMYGKDWLMNPDKTPLGKAKVLTLNQIKKKYLDICTPNKCVVKLDPVAKEKELNIVFSEMQDNKAILYPRVVWFEDEETVKEKKKALKEKGVSNFCYFALGYY